MKKQKLQLALDFCRDLAQVKRLLVEAIISAPRIFIAGAGRSGLAVGGFAMRLMHLGLEVHLVGQVTTPNITGTDLLLVGSGSGATGNLVAMVEKVSSMGAKVAFITTVTDSPIGRMADLVLVIPAPTPKASGELAYDSIQPMGSLFEQSLLLTLDALILLLIAKLDIDAGMMFTRHANLE